MAERDTPPTTPARPRPRTAPPSSVAPPPFDRAKRHLAFACAAIGVGLGCAGSLDRTTGGVLVLVGWAAAVVSLHRLGRAGADRSPDPTRS